MTNKNKTTIRLYEHEDARARFDWQATHRIETNTESLQVCFCDDGALYTFYEWWNDFDPAWTWDDDDGLRFYGQAIDGAHLVEESE